MANYTDLKAAVAAVIKANGLNQITGPVLQNTLLTMIDALGQYATFVGNAVPATNPGTPDSNVFYFASTPGTYVNFGGLIIGDGQFYVIKNNSTGTWVPTLIFDLSISQLAGNNTGRLMSQKAISQHIRKAMTLALNREAEFTNLQIVPGAAASAAFINFPLVAGISYEITVYADANSAYNLPAYDKNGVQTVLSGGTATPEGHMRTHSITGEGFDYFTVYFGASALGTSGRVKIKALAGVSPYVEKTFLFDNTAEAVTLATTLGALTPSGDTIPATTDYLRTSVSNLGSYYVLHLLDGESYSYTGVIENASYAGVVYLNAAGSTVGSQCAGVGIYVDEILVKPPTALYAAFCGKGGFNVKRLHQKIKPSLLPNNIPGGSKVVYVDAAVTTTGDGSAATPFKTISEAITDITPFPNATVIISEGDYRETLAFNSLGSGNFTFVNREGHRVRILGSQKLEGFTKTSGRTNIYQVAFDGTIPNWSRHANPIFEDGRPSKEILPSEYHPLQKNLTHRLPFTDIKAVESLDDLDTTPGSYFLDAGILYVHTSESDDPNTNGYSYETIVRSANGINAASTTTKKTNLHLKGLQFFYNTSGLRLNGFNDCLLEMVVSLGTPAAGAICPNTGNNTLIYCEAGFCNGDGYNGHFSGYAGYASLADNRSNYPTTKYISCWAHDNFDDGESSHEQHNVYMDSVLLEYNGDSGCRPSNDATYYAKDSIFRNNGWQVGHGGSAGKGEGFSVVNPAINPNRLGCRAVLFNCLSYGNNTGYATISQDANQIELINCTSRNNSTAEFFAGLGVMILRNCKATNADPAKLKVLGTGTITVLNDEILA